MKVFVDTNILVDLVCTRIDHLEEAKKLFAMGYAHRIKLSISALSYVNTVYIGRKYGFSSEQIINILSNIASFTETSDLSGDVVNWALASNWKDFEDATQYKAAIESNADCIVTRNKKDFKMSSIPVYYTNELLSLL